MALDDRPTYIVVVHRTIKIGFPDSSQVSAALFHTNNDAVFNHHLMNRFDAVARR